MDLDDIRQASKEVKAPQTAFPVNQSKEDEMEPLLQKIRETDERESRQMRKALPFYLLAAGIFGLASVVALVQSFAGSGTRAVHLGTLGAVFLTVGAMMLHKVRTIGQLDYSLPVREFLDGALRRYRWVRPLDLCYMIPLLIALGVTGGFYVVSMLVPRYIAETHVTAVVVVYGLFFAIVTCMGWIFTSKNWRRDKGGILDEIIRMRRELD